MFPRRCNKCSDLEDIYEVPLKMFDEGLDRSVDKRLNLETNDPDLDKWKNMLKLKDGVSKTVEIAILGKYFDCQTVIYQ